MKSTNLRYLIIIVLLMTHLFAKKSTSKRVLVSGTKQGRWANMAGGPTRQVDNVAGGPTRQVGQQGRWANKAGGPTRQVSQQGRQAYLTTSHVLKLLTLATWKKKFGCFLKQYF